MKGTEAYLKKDGELSPIVSNFGVKGDVTEKWVRDNFVGLTTDQTISGEKTFADAISMDGNPIKGLADPAEPQDAATKKYIDDKPGGGLSASEVQAVQHSVPANTSTNTTADTTAQVGNVGTLFNWLRQKVNGIIGALTQSNLRTTIFGASAIGAGNQPVHFAANGVPTPSTTTVGSATMPTYRNAGVETALTQANLRQGLFGATAIGSTQAPVYIAANGVPTALTQANMRIGTMGAAAVGNGTTRPIYFAANGVPTQMTTDVINATATAQTKSGNLTVGNPAVGTAAARNIYAGTSPLTHNVSALTTGQIYIQYS